MEKEEVFRKVGMKIREERLRQNMTITQLSDKLNMEYNNLIRIEKGRTNPTLGTLYAIAQALNIELTKIIDI